MKNKIIKSGLAGLVLLGGLATASPSFTQTPMEENVCVYEENWNEDNFTYGYKPSITGMLGDGKLEFYEAKEIVSKFGNELHNKEDEATWREETEGEIRNLEQRIIELTNANQNVVYPSSVQEEIKTKVLVHYPGILGKEMNVVYNGESILDNSEKKYLYEIIQGLEKNEKLKENQSFSDLLERKGNLRIMDALILYDLTKNIVMPKESEIVKNTINELMQEKDEFQKVLNQGYAEETLVSKDEYLLNQCSREILGYTELETILNNIKKIGDLSKYYSNSVITQKLWEENGFLKENYEKKETAAIKNLELCIKTNSRFISTQFENLPNPQKTKIPIGLGAVLGMVLPALRNLALTYYLTGGKPKGSRMFGSSLASIANGLSGIIFLDGIHPAIYPIRLFLTPVIMQPILKWTKYYKKHDGSNPMFKDTWD